MHLAKLQAVALIFTLSVLSSWAQAEESGDTEFPDLATKDETGGLMDEFAFLEEELADDEVVSASKHRQSIYWSPSAVTVFSREDIQASGAADLADLLRRVPGFDVYRLKASYPLMGARAATDEYNNQVLLLIDGREPLIELSGFPFWRGLSVDISEMERVEVIRGPGSTLYGANAFTAVVSVTTVAERPETGADIHLEGGELGHQRHFGRLRLTSRLAGGLLSATAGFGIEEQLNASNTSDQKMSFNRFHGVVRYQGKSGLDLSLHGGLTTGKSTIYLMLGDMYTSDLLLPWVLGKAKFDLGENSRLSSQVYLSTHKVFLHARTAIRAFDIWVAYIPDLDWNSYTVDGQAQFEIELAKGLLFILGANVRYSALSGELLILPNDDEMRGATFVHLNWQPTFGEEQLPIQLTGGLRVDFNDLTGVTVSPRTALVYRTGPSQSFRVSYGSAFRKPSFLESRLNVQLLEYNSATPEIVDIVGNMANPDLKNEKVSTFEAGWKRSFLDSKLVLSADLFFSLYQDLSVYYTTVKPSPLGLPDLANSSFGFTNDDPEITAVGGEAELSWRASDQWTLWCNLGLRQTFADKESQWTESEEPTLRVNLGGRYQSEGGWIADLALHYVSSYQMRLARVDNLIEPAWELPLGNQVLAVGRLGRQFDGPMGMQLEIGLQIRTPLGAPFREYAGKTMQQHLTQDNLSDWGGEMLVRQASVYLQGRI